MPDACSLRPLAAPVTDRFRKAAVYGTRDTLLVVIAAQRPDGTDRIDWMDWTDPPMTKQTK
jgi:hypothetical protein